MTSSPQQIYDSSSHHAPFLWVFGIASICGSALIVAGIDHGVWNFGYVSFAVIFASIGLLLLALAIHFSRSAARYGRSVFDSLTVPAVRGGAMAGTIRLATPLIYRGPIQLRLACTVQFRTGDDSQPKLVWEEHCQLDQFSLDACVSEIPVYFRMPRDGQPTSLSISWRLDVWANAAGGHYRATFQIPVGSDEVDEQAESLEAKTLADAMAALRSAKPPLRQPVERYILFLPMAGGGARVELLPGRNRVAALIASVLAAGFIGFGVAFLYVTNMDADATTRAWLATTACGIGAMMLLVSLRLFLLKTTVTVGGGKISIENSVGIGTRRREIRSTDIQDITVKIQGSVQNTLIYSINAVRNKQRSVKICGTIYDKGDADWLAAEFKRELQMQ